MHWEMWRQTKHIWRVEGKSVLHIQITYHQKNNQLLWWRIRKATLQESDVYRRFQLVSYSRNRWIALLQNHRKQLQCNRLDTIDHFCTLLRSIRCPCKRDYFVKIEWIFFSRMYLYVVVISLTLVCRIHALEISNCKHFEYVDHFHATISNHQHQ